MAQVDVHTTCNQEVTGLIPARSGNILSWRLIMKYFLWSFSPFHWFKNGSCQFLIKECRQVLVKCLEDYAWCGKVWLGKLTGSTWPWKKVREKSRECHNHKPQPFPDPKRKRKPTNPNKHKSNKRTKSTKISSLFPKRGNHNTKRTEKHKNKMTHGKTYNKSPRRINHKATKSKTNTGTTALERSVE